MKLVLSVDYPATGDPSDFQYIIDANYTTHASVWWGTRLLNAYWAGLLTTMSQVSTGENYINHAEFTWSINENDKKYIKLLGI